MTDTGIILTGAAVSMARSWVDTVLHICKRLLFDEPLPDGKVFADDRFLNKIHKVQPAVYDALKEVLATEEYRYLNDLTNTMKHRELIQSRAVLSSSSSDILVESFDKDGRSWDACTVTETIERCDVLFRSLQDDRELILFSDESIAKGTYYSNFLRWCTCRLLPAGTDHGSNRILRLFRRSSTK